jgi:acyl transferase domain-containing protein
MPEIQSRVLLRHVRVDEATHGAFRARERFHREAVDLIEREKLIASAFSFRIAELDAPAEEQLRVGGETLYAPRLLPEAGELTGLACGVVTIGSGLERRVAALFAEKCYSLALALDDIGNQLLFAATRHAQDRMLATARAQGLSMAGELRPGDPGLALQTQGLVLRLADAGSIGVAVNRGNALTPLKSISMVLGVGLNLPPVRWSRCDDCPSREKCRVANCPAQPAA